MDSFGDPAPTLIKHGSAVRESNDSSNSSSSSSMVNGSNYAISGKAMLCSVIVLFAALVLILGFHTYARRLFWCHRRRRRGLLPLQHAGTAESQKRGGLEVSVIKSLPTFTFHADSSDNLGDCPVCLSEFDDGESGRALPKCGHAFHVECIDMWFYNHSNCPLCRAPVQARLDSNSSTTIPTDVSLTGQENENHANAGVNDSPSDVVVVITVEAPPPTEERFRSLPETVDSGPDEGDRDKSQPNRFCL